jgi:glycosyltransferase involved in cell wall biosynthesis
MRNVSVDVLEPFISDVYSKPSLPAKPIVSVLTRDQRDTINLVKSFYIKFPQYRWITFRDMRNLTEKQFADGLKDVCLSVWVDEISSYGTFPLESMKTGVPVLGLVPNIVPSWLNENNGLWANNKVQIVDFVADYLQSWLEDNIDSKIYDEMENTVSSLSTKEKFDTEAVSLIEGYINTRLSSFEEQLSKLETIEE